MKKSIFYFFLVSALPAQLLRAQPSAESLPLTSSLIDTLALEGSSRNPSLLAAQARVEAAATAIDSVRTWEDPTVSIGFSKPTARGFRSEEEGNIIYGIDQKLPTSGRAEAARRMASAGSAKEKLMAATAMQRLKRDITVSLVGLALVDATIELTWEDLRWIDAMTSSVEHRYQVARASQVDWLRIQTERARTADRMKSLKAEREHGALELNRLLNRDLHSPWARVELPALDLQEIDADKLAGTALQMNPNLALLRQEIVQSEAAFALTKNRRKPDIGVGLQARQYSGDAGLREGMLTVSMSLPWLNKKGYDSDSRRDRAMARAASEDAADFQLMLREQIHHLTVDLDAARREALLYRDEIIPLTEQTLTSARSSWENNLGGLQDIIDARRMLVDNRLMVAKAIAEQSKRFAELAYVTGEDHSFESTKMANAAGPASHPNTPPSPRQPE